VSEPNRLLQRLCDADIDFVIVGGFAAVLHGSTMVTRDLDVCAPLTVENLARLRAAFRDIHPTHRESQRLSFLENPAPDVPLRNLYLQTDLGELDLLGSITGVGSFERVLDSAVVVELFGRPVRVISVQDLIQAKEALGREKDRLVVRELRAIQAKTD
jgi:predicted nucleotidyltransferase